MIDLQETIEKEAVYQIFTRSLPASELYNIEIALLLCRRYKFRSTSIVSSL